MAINLRPDKIGAQSGFETMRASVFEVNIPGLDRQDSAVACVGAPFPKFNVATIDYRFQNTVVKIASFSNLVQDMSLDLRDIVSGNVRRALWNWALLVYDPKNRNIGMPSEYKKDVTMVMAGPDGGNEQEWILSGCFPSAIDFGKADVNSDGPVLITATLSIDWIDLSS